MLVILPPSKSMDMKPVDLSQGSTIPVFQQNAEFIAEQMRNYSEQEIKEKFMCSSEMALDIYNYYKDFDDLSKPDKAALWAFTGKLYNLIQSQKYTPADIHYAQQRLRMLSPLYGMLRPLDVIRPYYLLFTFKSRYLGARDMYDYWHDLITSQIIIDARSASEEILFAAPEDMLPAVNADVLAENCRFVQVRFRDWQDQQWKEERDAVDEAAAAMVVEIVTKKIEHIDSLKQWKWKGYAFNEALSDDRIMVFSRTPKVSEGDTVSSFEE